LVFDNPIERLEDFLIGSSHDRPFGVVRRASLRALAVQLTGRPTRKFLRTAP